MCSYTTTTRLHSKLADLLVQHNSSLLSRCVQLQTCTLQQKPGADPGHEIFIRHTTGRLFTRAALSLTYWTLLKDQLMLTSPEYG